LRPCKTKAIDGTTTKKCKTEKLKSKKRICPEVTVNTLEKWNPCSQSRRRKGKAAVGRICGKRKVLSLE